MMTSHNQPEPIPAPWVLVDDLTVDQTADLLERLTNWLTGPDPEAASRCTRALAHGETDDPVTIASWADALATRLRRLAEQSQLQPGWPSINSD
jgi:hypothetical protein